MLAQYKKQANMWLIVGFLVWFVGNLANGGLISGLQSMGQVIVIIGIALFIYGCINYAKAKGYHWALGLLGLLNLIGLIVLAVLPDKNKK